jgi:hypothetical protein
MINRTSSLPSSKLSQTKTDFDEEDAGSRAIVGNLADQLENAKQARKVKKNLRSL